MKKDVIDLYNLIYREIVFSNEKMITNDRFKSIVLENIDDNFEQVGRELRTLIRVRREIKPVQVNGGYDLELIDTNGF